VVEMDSSQIETAYNILKKFQKEENHTLWRKEEEALRIIIGVLADKYFSKKTSEEKLEGY